LREFLYILAPPMVSLAGLAAFETWWSAAFFICAIGLGTLLAVRRYEKHHRSEAFDDRLSSEKMEAAREWLIKDDS
jgi:hypothetical protein